MHERTERAIARLLFVFCCAIPTVATILMILVSWTPWYHEIQRKQLATELSLESGLTVRLADFDHDSPSSWTLHQVQVIEPETNKEVARVRRVTWEKTGDTVSIGLHQPELQSPMLKFAWSVVHDRFFCRPDSTGQPVSVFANDLTIHSETDALTLSDINASIQPRPSSVFAQMKCQLAGLNRSEISIAVTRDRSTAVPRTHWHLETGDTALPCSALSGYLPKMAYLGPNATFVGNLKWEVDRNGEWLIDLGGSQFSDIELSYFFENLPHRLSGKADLELSRCQIVPDQRSQISGELRAKNGWMGKSLLRSLYHELSFAVDSQSIQQQSGDIQYDLLAFQFDMNESQLRLHGTCQNEPGYEVLEPGIVAVGYQRPLAKSSEQTIPSVKVAYAIAAENSQLVPVSPHTAPLLKIFVPPSNAVPIDQSIPAEPYIKRTAPFSGGEPIRQP